MVRGFESGSRRPEERKLSNKAGRNRLNALRMGLNKKCTSVFLPKRCNATNQAEKFSVSRETWLKSLASLVEDG